MTDLIKHSALESEKTGLKIGRVQGYLTNPEELRKQIFNNGFELCKLTTPSDDAELYTKLDALEIPYYVLGMVMEYRINFKKHPYKTLYHPESEMVLVDQSNVESLWQIAYESFLTTPGSFMLNPRLIHRLKKETQAELLADYVCSFQSQIKPDHYTHLLKHKGEYTGFIAHSYDGVNGHAQYAGVKPTRQAQGYYLDLVRFIQNHCLDKSISWGHASAQLQNTVVHKVYMKENMIPYRSWLNIHLVHPEIS